RRSDRTRQVPCPAETPGAQRTPEVLFSPVTLQLNSRRRPNPALSRPRAAKSAVSLVPPHPAKGGANDPPPTPPGFLTLSSCAAASRAPRGRHPPGAAVWFVTRGFCRGTGGGAAGGRPPLGEGRFRSRSRPGVRRASASLLPRRGETPFADPPGEFLPFLYRPFLRRFCVCADSAGSRLRGGLGSSAGSGRRDSGLATALPGGAREVLQPLASLGMVCRRRAAAVWRESPPRRAAGPVLVPAEPRRRDRCRRRRSSTPCGFTGTSEAAAGPGVFSWGRSPTSVKRSRPERFRQGFWLRGGFSRSFWVLDPSETC
ncbi:LOW QUALITY PROTEIN: uncharacterized protein LOC142048900, partial [Phalacrocorax aristotelis]|uniref:LOW QUALITY PROTEIN: uncharacterized protein LOC142048900 n=1 Tax=Phalacrocorax aristotelis TaxID=126867 RepID=UPI003F4BC9A4